MPSHYARCLLLLCALCSSGCSVFYDNCIDHAEFTLFSDAPIAELTPVEAYANDTMMAYRELFQANHKQVPPPVIIYSEAELSQRRIFTQELRQEGFYLPLLDLVHLSPHRDDESDENSERRGFQRNLIAGEQE